MTTSRVRVLEPGERDVAAGVMARAFGKDEMATFALPDAAERARRLPGMMGRTIDHARRYGDVRTTGATPGTTGVDGVACWLAPGTTSLTLPRVLRSGLVLLPVNLGLAAARRMSGLDAPMNAAHARLMPDRHWYLGSSRQTPPIRARGSAGPCWRTGWPGSTPTSCPSTSRRCRSPTSATT